MYPDRSITMKYRMQYAITNWTRLCRLEKGVCLGVRKGCAQCGLGGICVSVFECVEKGGDRGAIRIHQTASVSVSSLAYLHALSQSKAPFEGNSRT